MSTCLASHSRLGCPAPASQCSAVPCFRELFRGRFRSATRLRRRHKRRLSALENASWKREIGSTPPTAPPVASSAILYVSISFPTSVSISGFLTYNRSACALSYGGIGVAFNHRTHLVLKSLHALRVAAETGDSVAHRGIAGGRDLKRCLWALRPSGNRRRWLQSTPATRLGD